MADDGAAASARRRGAGRVCGVAGQILNAATNVATSYVASLLLVPADFGRFVIAFGAVTVVLGAGRGLLGATMLVHLPTCTVDEQRRLVASALGFVAIAGAGATLLLAVAGLWAPVLWWFAPWVIVALLQDAGRHVALATGRPARALVLDVAWALAQPAVIVLGVLLSGTITTALLATAWGLGALAGLLVLVALERVRPAHPSRWLHATRDVAGWFTASAVIGQVEVFLVLLLAGLLLAPADVGGLRAVQLMSLQPALVLLGSLLVVLQPTVVRAAARAGGLAHAWSRITATVSIVIAGMAAVALAGDVLVAVLFPQYQSYAHLVVPVALQVVTVALGVAPLAVLNGLRLGALAFRAQACRLLAAGVAVLAGAAVAGITGVAWALVVAGALSWLYVRVLARRAVRAHEARIPQAPATTDREVAT